MPAHDWTRVDAGLFHAFHQTWIVSLCHDLNAGGLPSNYYALPEQRINGPVPDVLTLRLADDERPSMGTAQAVAIAPPRARVIRSTEKGIYARKADRVTVKHRHGETVAVIEIVSPGNKWSSVAFRAFVEKVADLIEQGIHVLVIDLFPPTKRDPQGIHKAIWDEFEEEDFFLPVDKPLTVVAYSAGLDKIAYVEPFAVGDELPEMPLFLEPELYVPVSLEDTYRTTWGDFPAAVKGLLEANDARKDQPPGP